ncbi:hypothetical protein PENTCL1PPCAC_24149, partial [Pristionchus entomophagus]
MQGRLDDYYITMMNKTPCQVFEELQDPLYAIMVAAKCIVCCLGTAISAYQWKKIGVSWMVHSNTKILFAYYYAMVVLVGATFAALYAFEFVRLRVSCFHYDFVILLAVRGTGIAAIVASNLIPIAISIERAFSALHPKIFESW